MNAVTLDILRYLFENKYSNQREIAAFTGLSLGKVNSILKLLEKSGYITGSYEPTDLTKELIKESKPTRAIILAAGFGTRMIPINFETPKALLEVHGEPLIERLIKQLHEVGVDKITIVIGFQKEKFEYLIDQYGVDLSVNADYVVKNNLSSLAKVIDSVSNTYIVPADLWCEQNPFSPIELYSWYMVSDRLDKNSDVSATKRHELVKVARKNDGNRMLGIAYITGSEAVTVRDRVLELAENTDYDSAFWEEALYKDGKMILAANLVRDDSVIEINTYEQLRELDSDSTNLRSKSLHLIAEIFGTSENKITGIKMLKKGMTNKSFRFVVNHDEYIMRIPGEGTDKLINRRQEAKVLNAIQGSGFCDDPIYLDPDSGYKVSRFIPDVRCCDPCKESDIRKCMTLLKKFHYRRFTVDHTFDIYGQIEFYESLWVKDHSAFSDYQMTKNNVWKLKDFIDSQPKDFCLTHIDAVPDNFLFSGRGDEETLQLTDWEYSGMQDPHVDIAMFCIYSLYSKEQADHLIDIYFDSRCEPAVRAKIYCYIAACGLLWSNWCEFKQEMGVKFGEYSLRQYRYAKDFYRFAVNAIQQIPTEAETFDE